jgi:hypothetical protein
MHRTRLLLLVSALLFISGCAIDPARANVTTVNWWFGGMITVESKPLDGQKFAITATGAPACNEEQVTRAWTKLADKVSNGRPYKKTLAAERFQYRASGPYDYSMYEAIRVVGQITLVK